ncbi:AbiJ-NTD4 domain-containing protein [Aeromonas caviae]|uniref:AbiJ-NTD4 domain-containing protein n=1 Tax=Aeromonas caviae TaxID=648 RepID=UPI000A8C8C97|nr:hypothetical protein [Aeromonas caviae]
MKFSERIGKRPVKDIIQIDGMDDDLRNSLWNVLELCIWRRSGFLHRPGMTVGLGTIDDFSAKLWTAFYKRRLDSRPHFSDRIMDQIRSDFFSCEWFDVYDFLEFVLNYKRAEFIEKEVNSVLERELAGYRYISGNFVQVTDKQEIESIEQALDAGPFAGVEAHLRSAIDHLSRKQDPDYRNSIKESISAVESLAKELTDNHKATLGQALSILEKDGKIHPALKSALTALYGYTSDEGGIRHAMLDEPNLSASDAKFLLVACSAFINYLKEKV